MVSDENADKKCPARFCALQKVHPALLPVRRLRPWRPWRST